MKADTAAIYERRDASPETYHPDKCEKLWAWYCGLCKKHGIASRPGSKARFVEAWCDLMDDGVNPDDIKAGAMAFAHEHRFDASGIPQGHIFLVGKGDNPEPYWQASLERSQADAADEDSDGLATSENVQKILVWMQGWNPGATDADARAYIAQHENPASPKHAALMARLSADAPLVAQPAYDRSRTQQDLVMSRWLVRKKAEIAQQQGGVPPAEQPEATKARSPDFLKQAIGGADA